MRMGVRVTVGDNEVYRIIANGNLWEPMAEDFLPIKNREKVYRSHDLCYY